MNTSLFDHADSEFAVWTEYPAADVCLMHGGALSHASGLWEQVQNISCQAPFRHMQTPSGKNMRVANTSCGKFGWISDRSGYRYSGTDPLSGEPWPTMPPEFLACAIDAAIQAGYPQFEPDSCLINRYKEKTSLSLHQDKDEQDFTQPIVSVSLGMPAIFLFGGMSRTAPAIKLLLEHGDVLVWGGSARLHFHGVQTMKYYPHPVLGDQRINLTFRRAR